MKIFQEHEFSSRLKLARWLGHQTWLPRGQDRLLRAILPPDQRKSVLFEVNFFGQKYRGDLAEYIDWAVFCYGSYCSTELSLLRAVTSHLRRRRSGATIQFVDVGANVGHHTLFMAGLVDHVLAFEPFPFLHPFIEEKIALNGLKNVSLVPVALGDRDQILDYYPGGGSNSGIGSFVLDADKDQGQVVRLPVKRGDSLFDDRELGRIDIMKVDVEGFEPFVFWGLADHIKRNKPIILTEMSEKSRSSFGSQAAFVESFYDGAKFAEVTGRHGQDFVLRPFVYEASREVVILPPDLHDFLKNKII